MNGRRRRSDLAASQPLRWQLGDRIAESAMVAGGHRGIGDEDRIAESAMVQAGAARFDLPFTRSYFGGKGAPATVRALINVMPPHSIYVEPFIGSGRVMRHKLPASGGSFGFDFNVALIDEYGQTAPPDVAVAYGCGMAGTDAILSHLDHAAVAAVYVYADPPYLKHVRRSARDSYAREWTAADHARFVQWARGLPCMVAVSHLPCVEYATAFNDWHSFTFTNHTRRGPQLEQVWTNYVPGPILHDYRFVGRDFRERERFKRQSQIILRRWNKLPLATRIALLAMLQHRESGDDRSVIAESAMVDDGLGIVDPAPRQVIPGCKSQPGIE